MRDDPTQSEAMQPQNLNPISEVLRLARAGYWEYDVASDTFTFNDFVYRLFKTTAEEVGGYRMSPVDYARRFCHPDDAYVVARELKALRETADPDYSPRIEHRILYNDGEVGHIMVRLSIAKDSQGRTISALGIIQDITDSKLMEQALEKRLIALTRPLDDPEGIRFEDLFNLADIQRLQDQFSEATGVASIITSSDGTPITKPSNFCRLCSDIIRNTEKGRLNCYKSDAMIGRLNPDGPIVQQCLSGGLWDAGAGISIGGKHLANWLIGQVRDSTQTDEGILAYAREIGADEQEVLAAFHEVTPMSHGQFEAIAQTLYLLANQLSVMAYQNVQQARFITELKQAEREQAQLERKLVQSQKLESIGRLAGGVAHDLNNLLTPILGYGELLQLDGSMDALARDSLDEIIGAGMRARDLVRQLLAFGRKQMLEYHRTDLNRIVAGVKKLLSRTIPEDIVIEIKPSAVSLPVVVDIGQIEQVIINLVVNAADAMPDGGKISLETSRIQLDEAQIRDGMRLDPGRHAVLTVEDTGHGMDEETLKQIFEPFFSTKGELGTGLGLATVYGIIKQHNGNIAVYSEPGRGTKFEIYMPVCGETDTDETPDAHESANLTGSETILLTEDSDPVRMLAHTILTRQGYTVLNAANGKEALAILESHDGPLHLLLTDVVMPELNGRDLYEKASERHPQLKVLYMSGYTNDVIIDRGVFDENASFIQKPFTIHSLAAKVRELLEP